MSHIFLNRNIHLKSEQKEEKINFPIFQVKSVTYHILSTFLKLYFSFLNSKSANASQKQASDAK
jgi:hypothetical protein